MRLISIALLGLVGGVVAGCDLDASTSAACKKDKFFCDVPKTRLEDDLKKLSDERLVQVARIDYEYSRPPTTDFAEEIARRSSRNTILRTLHKDSKADRMIYEDAVRSIKLSCAQSEAEQCFED